MFTLCHYCSSGSYFTDLLTPLATFFGLIVAAIIGIIAWDFQERKRIEIKLRLQTLKDALELFDIIAELSKSNVEWTKQPLGERFIKLNENVKRHLKICGNLNEIRCYKEFVVALAKVNIKGSTPQDLKNAQVAFQKLHDLYTMNVRREIGKKEIDITETFSP